MAVLCCFCCLILVFLECRKKEALRPSCDSCLLECQRTLRHIILAPRDLSSIYILLPLEFFTSHFFLAEIQWQVIPHFVLIWYHLFLLLEASLRSFVSESILKSAMALTSTIITFLLSTYSWQLSCNYTDLTVSASGSHSRYSGTLSSAWK
jgi:hypothetical protein